MSCALLAAWLGGAAGCDRIGGGATPADDGPREPIAVLDLPAPSHEGATSLERALASRASVRTFAGRDLSLAELSQLLWAADGITRASGKRTAPSAGARYPIEIYVVTAQQLLHYLPDGHRAEVLAEEDLLAPMRATAQDFVADGAALFVITAEFERTTAKYGARGERFVHLEAGHVAQNILLQAVALGLGAVPVGSFDDAAVSATLGLPDGHAPLYLIPVGAPA